MQRILRWEYKEVTSQGRKTNMFEKLLTYPFNMCSKR